jgi:hypothetical protein
MRDSRRGVLVAGAGMLALAALLANGCTGGEAKVILERGHTSQHQSWQLAASEQGGHLGLYLEELSGTDYSGSVGFNGAPSAGFWMEGSGPGDSIYYYGPVPVKAVKVELRAPGYAPVLIPTRPIPDHDGLPHGRFFIVAPPGGASVNWHVTLLDAAGHKVPFANF